MSASWINKLNESDSRLHKEDVLKQAHAAAVLGNEISIAFLRGIQSCYNSYITYGVKQIPDSYGIVDAENPWVEFDELLTNLSDRVLTGNDARDAIQIMSERFDSDEWNLFLAPILRRDMRCGISVKTFNKILKKTEYEIPVFGCQLATNSEGRPEMKGVKRLEPKLDGVRVLMMVTDYGAFNSIVSYSRNGKVFDNFEHIQEQLRSCVQDLVNQNLLSEGFILDGEVVGNSFQELMRQARRKDNVKAQDSVFHIFDIIPYGAFVDGNWHVPLSKRIDILNAMASVVDKLPNVELLPHIQVDLDTEAGQKQFKDYANEMVVAGFEGILIKDLDAPYECDRTTAWLKWKPVYDYDLTVVGMEEGTGKNKGRMGALICEGVDDNKRIAVNVGSGYTDVERQEYWDNQNEITGRTAVVLADAITQNQDGTYSLRFPRFKCFRTDK